MPNTWKDDDNDDDSKELLQNEKLFKSLFQSLVVRVDSIHNQLFCDCIVICFH